MAPIELTVDGAQAFVDGRPLEVPPGTDPAQALIAHAQQLASARGDQLVHVKDGQGTDTWLLIRQNGALEQAQPPEQEPQQPTVLPPTALESWSRLSSGNGTPRRGSTGISGAPRPSRRAALVAGGGALAALAVGGGLWGLTRDDDKSPSGEATPSEPSAKPTPTSHQPVLPEGQGPPAGWSREASWAVGNVLDPHPQVAVRDGLVALSQNAPGTGAAAVTVVQAESGHIVWSHPLPLGEVIANGPHLIYRGGLWVMVATETALWAWDARSGRQTLKAALPHRSASVEFSLLGPWVADKGSRYRALKGALLAPFDLPANSTCYGSVGDDLLVAGTDARVWKLTTGKKTPSPTKLETIEGMNASGPVIITDTLLVTSWTKDKATTLRAYDLKTLKPRWTSPPQNGWNAFMGATRISPDQSWATVSNRRVDLRNGSVQVIAAAWTPLAVGETHAWGDDGTYVLTCDRSGKLLPGTPSQRKNSTALVVGGTKDHVLVAAGTGGQTSLYALPRS